MEEDELTPSETEEELDDESEGETDDNQSDDTSDEQDEEIIPKWATELSVNLQQQIATLNEKIDKLTPAQKKQLQKKVQQNPKTPMKQLVLELENKTPAKDPVEDADVPEKKETTKALKLGQQRRQKRLARKTKNAPKP